jgi:hypothetical protein
MALDLSGKIEDQKLKGRGVIEIMDGEKVISKTTQEGDLSLVKKMEGSVGIVLTPSDSYYFQIYYLPEKDAFAGNYYAKSESGYLPTGTVRLGRK